VGSRFFFQAEDGIRDGHVTGVQTCALPISRFADSLLNACFVSDAERLIDASRARLWIHGHTHDSFDYCLNGTRVVCNPRGYARKIGRASCRERVKMAEGSGGLEQTRNEQV